LSSDFLFLPPFICLPGELRASLLPGRPFYPFHPGLLRRPGLGATGGRHFPPSLFGRGIMDFSIHHPPGAAPVGPREVQGRYPPHPGGHDAAVPRRLSSAFPPPPLAPPGSCPGDWETVTAGPGGPVSHEAGRLTDLVGQYYTLRYSTSDSICLYNVKNHKTCSGYLSVQIGRISSLFL
jgi:hypothetical protein